MSIEWFCGFENNSLRELDSFTSNAAIAAARTGMSGSYCLDLRVANTTVVIKTVTARADYYIGMRFSPQTGGHQTVVAWRNSGTILGFIKRNNTTGYFDLHTSTGASVASGTTLTNLDTTYLIEIYINIADSGSCVLKVNGVTDINYSGDTKPGSQTTIDNFLFGYVGSAYGYAYCYVDDIVIRTDAYTGDVRVGGKTVDGNSGSPQWTASTGDNWDCLNDVDDANYVYTNTNDNLDLYTVADVTEAIDTVQAVKVSVSARKQGAATPANLKLACQSGSYLSANKALPTSMGNIFNIWEGDPADSNAAWTETKLNDLVVGIKAVA
jgi:hypothetical protein